MRLLLLCILGWLTTAAVARAECDCLWQGSFVDVQAGADLVVSGTVARAKGNSIDLAVERTLRGSTDAAEIRIWLKTADYCRPEPELFPPGSEWVMALSRIVEDVPGGFNPNTPNVSYGRPGDYSLSSCGGYWLSRSGDWVSGNLVQAFARRFYRWPGGCPGPGRSKPRGPRGARADAGYESLPARDRLNWDRVRM